MKHYYLDTNSIIDNVNAVEILSDYKQNKVFIHRQVLDELDRLKHNPKLSHLVSQAVKRFLEKPDLYELCGKITSNHTDDELLNYIVNDTTSSDKFLITSDKILQVKAIKAGIKCEELKVLDPFLDVTNGNYPGILDKEKDELVKNCFYWEDNKLFINKDTPKEVDLKKDIWGVTPKDFYQSAMFELGLDPNINICTIQGPAGTGKTFLSLALAFYHVFERKTYSKIYITKAMYEIGQKLGFLPGPQPLGAKILTPNGWTTMGELKVGDYVIGRNGKKTKVLETFYKGIKDVYTIETTNGGVTKACGDHIWATKNNNELKHNKDFQLRSTLEIKNTLYNKNTGDKYNHTLPMNDIVEFDRNEELPIPPYTLGVVLGEGTKAKTKFIPDIYKYTSVSNRIALLQGLMDTDGTIKKSTGEQTFTTISKRLADDLIELARSLGINATYYTRNRVGRTCSYNGRIITSRNISYEVSIPKSDKINVFYLERKCTRSKNPTRNRHVKIKNIEYSGREEVKCIRLDNEDNLYITDNYIVTHNTVSEKLLPYMEYINSLIGKLTEHRKINKLYKDEEKEIFNNKKFQILPINFIRGRDLEDAFIIVDEVQNLSRDEIRTLLSRMGNNIKCICIGDKTQIDSPYLNQANNAMSWILKKFKGDPIYAHLTMKSDHYRGPICELVVKTGL